MTDKSPKPRDPVDMNHPDYSVAEDPTHPFFEGDKSQAEEESGPNGEEAYKVGPGRPPEQYKYKKGCPSPNPKGRPKKIPTMKLDVKKTLEAALSEKVVITDKDKKVSLTKVALAIRVLVNQAAKGDRHARRDLFDYAARFGVDLHAKEALEEALGNDAQAIADAYVRRHLPASAEPSPEVHVKAPADLLDDDVPRSSLNRAQHTHPHRLRGRCRSNPCSMRTASPCPLAISGMFGLNASAALPGKRNRPDHERAHSPSLS